MEGPALERMDGSLEEEEEEEEGRVLAPEGTEAESTPFRSNSATDP